MGTSKTADPSIALIGTDLFGRQLQAYLSHQFKGIEVYPVSTTEAWSTVLEHHPSIVLIEINQYFNKTTLAWLRSFLEQVRDRFADKVCVILALLACEKLFFAGDLLFSSPTQLTSSNLIDSLVVKPPSGIPHQQSIHEQIKHRVVLWSYELERRKNGGIAAPTLASDGWVQSMADPSSCELWLRWLPRYAIYGNENPIIIGETGTGKTNLAYALHHFSGRKGNFVSITPRDFSSSELVQAELFGAVAGAYTGAVDKWGLVKSAEGGTLFIDELQSIDKDLQGKLITFIENKTYRRVGSAESVAADVRFVFASNKAIPDMIRTDILREDFAYRLERVQLELKPLRLRRLDVTAALAFALAKIDRQRPHSVTIEGFNNMAYRLLFSANWPGNLRQLENKVAQLCEVADMHKNSLIDHKMFEISQHTEICLGERRDSDVLAQATRRYFQEAIKSETSNKHFALEQFVETIRLAALEACSGDVEQAAKIIDEQKEILDLFAQGWAAREELETFR